MRAVCVCCVRVRVRACVRACVCVFGRGGAAWCPNLSWPGLEAVIRESTYHAEKKRREGGLSQRAPRPP